MNPFGTWCGSALMLARRCTRSRHFCSSAATSSCVSAGRAREKGIIYGSLQLLIVAIGPITLITRYYYRVINVIGRKHAKMHLRARLRGGALDEQRRGRWKEAGGRQSHTGQQRSLGKAVSRCGPQVVLKPPHAACQGLRKLSHQGLCCGTREPHTISEVC